MTRSETGTTVRAGICALLLCMPAAACAQTREVQERNLAEYLEYAGAPIDHFRFWRLTGWELVGPRQLVVWPGLTEAYLLTVDPPCPDLEWAKTIGLTSNAHTVTARFDSVDVGREKCRIAEIRPIDYERYRADRRGAG